MCVSSVSILMSTVCPDFLEPVAIAANQIAILVQSYFPRRVGERRVRALLQG